MSNLNFISEIQNAVASISAISISFIQKVQQKCEICFEIKYFDEEFNLSKSDQSHDYDDNSTDDEDSDNEESNQKLSENTHLVLLAALQQSDSLIYSEIIQNAQNTHINNEISSSSDEVFATKEQLSHEDLIKSASYKEVMNSWQHDH